MAERLSDKITGDLLANLAGAPAGPYLYPAQPQGMTGSGPLLDALAAGGQVRLVTGDAAPGEGLEGLDALQALVDSGPYRRGQWRWEIRRPPETHPWDQHLGMLHVAYETEDAYHPGRRKWQQFACTIPAEIDAARARVEHWRVWLFSVICYIELHEAAEFYLPYGERVFDPHAERPAGRWRPGAAEVMRFVPDDDMLGQQAGRGPS